jgi:hypothetical protein
MVCSLGQGSLRLTPGEEPWRDIGAPTKYLGKIYIDRRTGERPERYACHARVDTFPREIVTLIDSGFVVGLPVLTLPEHGACSGSF